MCIRDRSLRSAETGKRISARVEQIHGIMKTTLDSAEQSVIHDKESVSLAGELVEHVLTHVRKLGTSADQMQRHGIVVRGEVEKQLVALQFQDRISQLLDGILDNIEHMRHTLIEAGMDALPSTEEWIDSLNDCANMTEQYYQQPQQ